MNNHRSGRVPASSLWPCGVPRRRMVVRTVSMRSDGARRKKKHKLRVPPPKSEKLRTRDRRVQSETETRSQRPEGTNQRAQGRFQRPVSGIRPPGLRDQAGSNQRPKRVESETRFPDSTVTRFPSVPHPKPQRERSTWLLEDAKEKLKRQVEECH